MKLLIFSDIHADHRALEKLMETDADLYFAAKVSELTTEGLPVRYSELPTVPR